MIYNRMTQKIMPWLATDYQWSSDLKTLTFTIRSGVKWSDGTDFTAQDVAYTFNLLKGNSALQGSGQLAVGSSGYVSSVNTPDATTVQFTFNKVYVPGLYDIIQQIIVPEHIWKNIADPVKDTNDNPVATGPFTQVVNFQTSSYEVDRNPNYWQPGEPHIKGVRAVAFSGNDTAATMFVAGQVDWSGQFFPNIQQAVISKNPTDLHYWWPTTTSTVLFMLNDTKKPFDDPIMRKAISMAFNREQLIQIAVQGASAPADVTSLSAGYSQYKVADPTTLGTWTDYNPTQANQMLDSAGYKKGSDGFRTQTDGTTMSFTILEVNGFTDYLAMAPLMVQELKAIGLNVTTKSEDVAIALNDWQTGNFDMSPSFGYSTVSIYTYYRAMMSTETVLPIGTAAPLVVNNWRYGNTQADAALQQFATTTDLTVQKQAADTLQKIFADEAPVIPLYYAPTFYNYSTKLVTGWPSADDPYAYPIPVVGGSAYPEQELVMLGVKPK